MNWYDVAMKHVVDQTWVYQCCTWDLCSKRFHRFCVRKYMEEDNNVIGGIVMFYCLGCAHKKGWPETLSKSIGPCEICGKTAACNSMATKDLPRPIPNEDEEECK